MQDLLYVWLRLLIEGLMNILVTGANGQLGRKMRLSCLGSGDRYVFSDVVPADDTETEILDIADADAVHRMVMENDIDCIVNCAAYTDVDRAESDTDACYRLNAEAPGILAGQMKDAGGLLVHISTDYVFGGDPYNIPCTEDRQGTPVGTYGRTKLEGEKRIMETGCDHVIIRTSWLYSETGKNFVRTIMGLTAVRPHLDVVFDQTGTPTYAGDLALAIRKVLSDYVKESPQVSYSKAGIYHYSNEGVCSWYDFAKMIAEYSGHTSCNISPCHSKEFPSPVLRPSYSVLDKTKIKRTFGLDIPYWTDSLKRCIGNIKRLDD